MPQYLGKERLTALGFQQVGKHFILKKQEYDREKRRVVSREVGKIKLDRKGYVLQSKGFPVVNGKIMLHQNTGRW